MIDENLNKEIKLFHSRFDAVFNIPSISNKLIQLRKDYYDFILKLNDSFTSIDEDNHFDFLNCMKTFEDEFKRINDNMKSLNSIVWHEVEKLK